MPQVGGTPAPRLVGCGGGEQGGVGLAVYSIGWLVGWLTVGWLIHALIHVCIGSFTILFKPGGFKPGGFKGGTKSRAEQFNWQKTIRLNTR